MGEGGGGDLERRTRTQEPLTNNQFLKYALHYWANVYARKMRFQVQREEFGGVEEMPAEMLAFHVGVPGVWLQLCVLIPAPYKCALTEPAGEDSHIWASDTHEDT